MGSQKKEAILQAKWAVNFVKKAKWANNELRVSGLQSSHLLLQQRESFQFYSALQLSSSHLWRTTWNSLLCCNITLLIRFSNFYLHFNYSMQKRNFLESKMGERESKMGESEKQNR